MNMAQTYKGIVRGGMIVLPEDVRLPEGTEVVVSPVQGKGEEIDWRTDPLLNLPAVDLGVEDLAWEHDYYAYGGEKRGNMPRPKGS
jgi:hypothetical protein